MTDNPAEALLPHGDAIALARAWISDDDDAWNAIFALPTPYPPSALLRAAFAMLAPALAAPPSMGLHEYLDNRADALGDTLAILRGSAAPDAGGAPSGPPDPDLAQG